MSEFKKVERKGYHGQTRERWAKASDTVYLQAVTSSNLFSFSFHDNAPWRGKKKNEHMSFLIVTKKNVTLFDRSVYWTPRSACI